MGEWLVAALIVGVVAWLLLGPRKPQPRGGAPDASEPRRRRATRTGFEDDFDGFGAGGPP